MAVVSRMTSASNRSEAGGRRQNHVTKSASNRAKAGDALHDGALVAFAHALVVRESHAAVGEPRRDGAQPRRVAEQLGKRRRRRDDAVTRRVRGDVADPTAAPTQVGEDGAQLRLVDADLRRRRRRRNALLSPWSKTNISPCT